MSINEKRRFLRERVPEMAERVDEVSDLVIEVAYQMHDLDDEELKVFSEFLNTKVK